MSAASLARTLAMPQPRELRVPRAEARKSTSVRSIANPTQAFSVFILITVLIGAVLLINVALHALIAQGAIDVDSLKKDIQKTKALQESLRLEKARLQAPARIESIAVTKLGMIKPTSVSYIDLSSGTTVAGAKTDRNGVRLALESKSQKAVAKREDTAIDKAQLAIGFQAVSP